VPDWLEERIRREVAGWDTPPPRLRAARYKRLEPRAPRAGRLVLALAVAVAAVGVGSAQVGAVPARVVQLVSQAAQPAPSSLPSALPTPDADDSPAATGPAAPPAPNRPITIVGAPKESPSAAGHRPFPSPSGEPRSDDRDHSDGSESLGGH
jgi:hypothetical protein